jgi:hypothetical protein
MPEVPRVETPFQEASIAELLRLELLAQGLDPHQDMAALLLAQIALETNRGHSCQNHNVGNITTFEGAADYYRPIWFAEGQTNPHLIVLHEAMKKNAAPRAFRSFADFRGGVSGYVAAAKHLSVVEAARTGDAETMATVIRSAYAPDAPPGTGKNLDSLRREYLARGLFDPLPKDSAPETPRDRGLRS